MTWLELIETTRIHNPGLTARRGELQEVRLLASSYWEIKYRKNL